MNEKCDPTSAPGIRPSDGEPAAAQHQIGGRTRIKDHLHLRPLGRVIPQLRLLTLACIITFAAGLNWAAATGQIPYKDAYQAQRVADNGVEQVFVGAGNGTHLGKFTSETHVLVGDAFFDVVSGFFLVPLSGTGTVTAANGDKLLSSFDGFEVLDFSVSGPLHFGGSQQITGGTGRFTGATGSLTFSGLDFGDGSISVTTKGTISSVGSNK